MPRKALRAAGLPLLLLFFAGCAGLSPSGPGSTDILERLFPAGQGGGGHSAEANIRISYGGRGVTLPAAAAFRAPGDFRIDVLDPLDRPVAMIFLHDGRIIQYRPASSVAAAVTLMPKGCSGIAAGAWAGYAVGEGPSAAERPLYRPSWPGLRELLRYEGGFPAERIVYSDGGEKPGLKKVEWFCRGDLVMKLVPAPSGGMAEGEPSRFAVSFPYAGLSIELEIGDLVPFPGADEAFFHPLLPATTRWAEWRLVDDN